uniref:Rhodanese domain-containing protein n=1 Tax=Arion vulgaris TaxID=1028688 RepID=A0A0B6YQQ1_9EUPU
MVVARVASLVSTNWLKQHIITTTSATAAKTINVAAPSTNLRVLDTSWLPETHVNGYTDYYQRGHIPGSLYFDLRKLSTKRPDSPIDCPIPDTNLFQEHVESLGITNDTHLIIYDQLNARPSVRSWYLFRLFGHDNVSILNGGMTHWVKDGLEITTEEPKVNDKSKFKVNFRPELLLDYQSMLNIVNSQSAAIVDSRPDVGGFYITDDDQSGGHMTEAKSIPFPKFFNEDGTFKSNKDLQLLFLSAGVDLAKPVVTTCLRGMTACAVVLAAYNLGKEDVPMYNGSWLEWSAIADPKNIIKTKKSP